MYSEAWTLLSPEFKELYKTVLFLCDKDMRKSNVVFLIYFLFFGLVWFGLLTLEGII